MTTSSNTSWELTRNQIIEAAYRKLGVPGEDNTLSTSQYNDGAQALNSVVALLNADGMPLWKRTTTNVVPSTTSQVYTLTDAIKVAQVSLYDITSGVKYDLGQKSLYDFNRLPQGAVGVPVNYTFAPAIQGGTVSIWPLTSDSGTVTNKRIYIVYQKEFDGFTASGETLDFPQHWHQAIIYELALSLAPEVGLGLQDRQELRGQANTFRQIASQYGDEDGSIYFAPDRW